MNQSNRCVSDSLSLDRLVSNALGQLKQLRYSRRSLNRYRAIWKHLIDFSRQNKLGDEFSEDLAKRFLDKYRLGDGERVNPQEGWRRHIVFGVKALEDFAHQGRIVRPFTDMQKIDVLPAMKKPLREYEQYCKDRRHLRPTSLQPHIRELTIFLHFLGSRNVKTLDQIQAVDLSEFVSSRDHLKPKTVARIISDVGLFLRFLTMRGILQKDLSLDLPKIRVPRDATIPSVWDHELIVKLLRVVDRSSAIGKRDYAILLLACRLGLRAGDIRTLKLDGLNWEDATIELIQSKTNSPFVLPLTEEVGEALIHYLKSGRPKTPHREVFLKLRSPFEPLNRNDHLYHIVRHWRQLAGITFRTKQRQGLHSLRHSLATRLLHEETPFQTISEILGHASLESTRIYAKADVEALRSVALDAEEVSDVD